MEQNITSLNLGKWKLRYIKWKLRYMWIKLDIKKLGKKVFFIVAVFALLLVLFLMLSNADSLGTANVITLIISTLALVFSITNRFDDLYEKNNDYITISELCYNKDNKTLKSFSLSNYFKKSYFISKINLHLCAEKDFYITLFDSDTPETNFCLEENNTLKHKCSLIVNTEEGANLLHNCIEHNTHYITVHTNRGYIRCFKDPKKSPSLDKKTLIETTRA